jgi:hypothetical protein
MNDNKVFRRIDKAYMAGSLENYAISVAKPGTEVEMPVGVVIVKEPCEADRGYWYCITHKQHFNTQLGKDIHIAEVKEDHELAWNCFEHGLEQA